MTLTLKMIENLLMEKKSESSIPSLILEYATLKQKLENTKNHSWYLKKGIESYEQKLASLADHYEDIRELCNKNSVDFFIHKINENNTYMANFNKGAMNAVVDMGFGLRRSNNRLCNELIQLKRKTEVLMPMDYYLQNPEAFLEIID